MAEHEGGNEIRKAYDQILESHATEARLCKSLSHPNILSTYDLDIQPEDIEDDLEAIKRNYDIHIWSTYLIQIFQPKTPKYLAMEYCNLGDLNSVYHMLNNMTYFENELLANEDITSFRNKLATSLVFGVGNAICYLHELKTKTIPLGIVHNDIKAENIMVHYNTSNKTVIAKLADFGLAFIPTRENSSLYGSDIKHDYVLSFWVFVGFILFAVVSAGALTIGRGVEELSFVKQFSLYLIIGIVGVLFIFLVDLFNFFTRKRNLKAILHDPEDSLFASVKFRVVFNPVLLALGSLLLFLPLTYFSARFKNVFFTAIPQQISEFSKVWADAMFPAICETLLFAVPYSLAVFWAERNIRNRVLYWFVTLLVFPLVFGLLWMFFHNAVYGSDDVALLATFVFGFVGTLLTMATRSLIPFAVVHFVSNLMLSLKRHGLFANDLTAFVLVVVWLFGAVLFFYVYKADVNKARG